MCQRKPKLLDLPSLNLWKNSADADDARAGKAILHPAATAIVRYARPLQVAARAHSLKMFHDRACSTYSLNGGPNNPIRHKFTF